MELVDPTVSGTAVRIYEVSGANGGTVGASVAPTVINSWSALTVPAYFRAMTVLSTNLASLSRSVHQDGAKTDTVDHPLNFLLKRQPNGYQNCTRFWTAFWLHAVHTGNGYAEITWDGSGYRPAGLHNMLPEAVTPFRYDRLDGKGPSQFYLYRPLTGPARVLPAIDVLHLSALSYDGMAGLDLVRLHMPTLQRAATITKYQTFFLQRGTIIRGSIEIPSEVTPDQVKEIVDRIDRHFRGPDAERDILVLSGGAKLTNTTISPQASQLVEQESQSAKAIGQITGVHPFFLFDDRDGKYNANAEQAGIELVRHCLRPWIEQAEDELSLKLLSERDLDDGYSVRLNADALLRGDTASVATIAINTKAAGIRTPNESRELLGLPPDPSPDSNKLQTLGSTMPPPAATTTVK